MRWEATEVKCPDDESGGDDGGGGRMAEYLASCAPQQGAGGPNIRITPTPRWLFMGGMIEPQFDESPQISYSFHITAATLHEAAALRDLVLANGVGTDVGFGFEIIHYSEISIETNSAGLPTGLRVLQAEIDDEFMTYSLIINDAVHAELGATGNVLHYGAANDWDVIETFVPISSLDTTLNAWDNAATSSWTTLRTPQLWDAALRAFVN
ncbi:MAG: hypothetical protein QF724_11200 [Planctomycetota bacterium]|nr:hypothetical protein [Planctomycetota bacterium]MDP6519099.1 hypothetical protein [Planctomycetota bacterium]MDP6839495.1 hypothetical protein [Planctomycetota bacterium]